MKKVLLSFAVLMTLCLSANAYNYQWNVPYDNYGKVYPGNVQGGYYYGGSTALVRTGNQPDQEILQDSYGKKHKKHRVKKKRRK